MKYNIKVGDLWLVGESATYTIKGTVRGDTTAVFSRMVGEMSAYDFADNRQEAASFDRITLCDYLRGIVERQNYGHYLGEIKVIPEDREEAKAQLPKEAHWVAVDNGCGVCSNCNRQDRIDSIATHCRYCGAKMEVQE